MFNFFFFPLSVSDVGSLCLNVFGFGLRVFFVFFFLFIFSIVVFLSKKFSDLCDTE